MPLAIKACLRLMYLLLEVLTVCRVNLWIHSTKGMVHATKIYGHGTFFFEAVCQAQPFGLEPVGIG